MVKKRFKKNSKILLERKDPNTRLSISCCHVVNQIWPYQSAFVWRSGATAHCTTHSNCWHYTLHCICLAWVWLDQKRSSTRNRKPSRTEERSDTAELSKKLGRSRLILQRLSRSQCQA